MIKANTIVVKQPDFTETGRALAVLVKQRIIAAPGNRWNKTGRLLGSVATVSNGGRISVVSSGDRLQTDQVAQMFAEEILPTELDTNTRAAIADAIFKSFKVSK